jgi:hypothetical protein
MALTFGEDTYKDRRLEAAAGRRSRAWQALPRGRRFRADRG